MNNRNKRILMSVLGVLICGISVGFFKRASFGVDPFQAFMSGLDAVIPISFGTLYVIANICLLLFSVLTDRTKIGIATIVNLLFLGYVADYTHQFLLKVMPNLGIVGRGIILMIAVVVMCLASAFYFTANLGVSTYDAISLIISEKNQKLQFKIVRVVSDLICVILGLVLFLGSGHSLSDIGQVIGIGTIITAFFMGPLIDYFNIHVARPFLEH